MTFFDINNIAFKIMNYPVSYTELIGTLFGLISVYFATKANILTWPTGILNELFLFILFYKIHLYADMTLQVYFFIVTIYGWYKWNEKKTNSIITNLIKKDKFLIVFLIIIGTILSGFLFKNIHLYFPVYFSTPSSYPFIDSFVMITSIIATVLLAKKKIETWYLWIIVDLVSILLYLKKTVYFLSLEYIIFLVLAAFGLFKWKKTMND